MTFYSKVIALVNLGALLALLLSQKPEFYLPVLLGLVSSLCIFSAQKQSDKLHHIGIIFLWLQLITFFFVAYLKMGWLAIALGLLAMVITRSTLRYVEKVQDEPPFE